MRVTMRFSAIVTMLFAGLVSSGTPSARGQSAKAASATSPSAATRSADGGSPGVDASQAAAAAVGDARTEKQKELAKQTEKLFDMATELKQQVDKTNKNILSMQVVEKAEAIELMAKGMKNQARH